MGTGSGALIGAPSSAVQRLTLAQIETAILQAFQYTSSAVAPWASQSNLYMRVNECLQRMPAKVAAAANQLRSQGVKLPYNGIPRFDHWRTQANLTCSSGSSTVYFPTDYDQYISFWDNTNSVSIHTIEDVDRYHSELRTESPGPPRFIELLGFVTNATTWVKQGTLFPSTMASTTPSIQCTYWRIPAKMPGSDPTAEYPDIDPKWESIAIYGSIADLARSDGFKTKLEWYVGLEKEMLVEMAMTAKGT